MKFISWFLVCYPDAWYTTAKNTFQHVQEEFTRGVQRMVTFLWIKNVLCFHFLCVCVDICVFFVLFCYFLYQYPKILFVKLINTCKKSPWKATNWFVNWPPPMSRISTGKEFWYMYLIQICYTPMHRIMWKLWYIKNALILLMNEIFRTRASFVTEYIKNLQNPKPHPQKHLPCPDMQILM